MRGKVSMIGLIFALWALTSPAYPCSYPTDSCPCMFVSGDFDNDGRYDVVFIFGGGRCAGGYASGTTYLKLATSEIRIELGVGLYLAKGDFNGDGNLDLMITTGASTHHILLGNGNGTFEKAPPMGGFHSTLAPVVFDYDGDGYDDFALTGGYNPPSVYLSNGDGTFRYGFYLDMGVRP